MKKTATILGVLLCVAISFFFVYDNTYANYKWKSYSDCIKKSGGRGAIESVQWACNKNNVASPTCALWLGGSSSVDTNVWTSSASGSVTVKFYRMCYNGANGTAHIWVSNDNGSINDSGNMAGGAWASPKSKNSSLNIGKFCSGLSPSISGDWYVYQRRIYVKRQNAAASSCSSWSGACAGMYQYITVYVPRPKKTITLTAYGVDSGGTVLRGPTTTSGTAYDGGSVYLSHTAWNIGGYRFTGWSTNRYAGSGSGGATYGGNFSSNAIIYAIYRQQITVNLYATAIDSKNGNVIASNFAVASRTIDSGTSTSLTVTATNYSGYTFKGWRDSKTGGFNSCGSNTTCTKTISGNTTLYAVYEPFSGESTLDMKVTNETIGTSAVGGTVYAKPQDKVTYQATYKPLAQGGYSIRPQQVQIGIDGTPTNTSFTLGAAVGDWKNAFRVDGSGKLSGLWNQDYKCDVGSTATRDDAKKSFTVTSSSVASTLTAKAETNLNSNITTTPRAVTMTTTSGGVRLGIVDIRHLSSTASTVVPYNFETHTEVDTNEDKPIYAGEETDIAISVDIDPKPNSKTTKNGEEYTTDADDVLHELVVYTPTDYSRTKKEGGTMQGERDANVCSLYFGYATGDEKNCGVTPHTEDTLTPGSHDITQKFYAQDNPAGSEVCIAVAVFPASSGADTNIDSVRYADDSGRSWWRISKSKCYKIAKKPSIQIWGGNIYTGTGNGIATSISKKNNLLGYNDANYSVSQRNTRHDSNSQKYYIFGSWNEAGIISGGSIAGMSSAANLGYSGTIVPNPFGKYDNNNSRPDDPGGGTETSVCKRSKLTFANLPCNNDTVGYLGNTSGTTRASNDKDAIISKLIPTSDSASSGNISVQRTSSVGNQSFSSGINVFYNDGDINITGNLTYSGSYGSFEEMPKLVIYGKDIKISCDVTEIDGLLIADNSVTTCEEGDKKTANQGGIQGARNSIQLMIRGAVVTGSLTANRTYGAATGANSIVPAEIINFDPSLYLWGNTTSDDEGDEDGGGNNDDSKNAKLETVLLNEISPRV